MTPKLVALQGPLKGQVLEFLEEPLSIGRDPSNRVHLRDSAVSRNHAVLRQDSGRIEIIDVGSQNGTFVNGVPVRERVLAAGDQIRIGHSLLELVVLDESLSQLQCEVQLDEALVTRSEVRIGQEDSPAVRAANDLQALLAICTDISAADRPDTLQQKLLESILKVIPADSGAVLLLDDESSDEFASTRGWTRHGAANETVHASKAVVQTVARERTALLSNDVCKLVTPEHRSLLNRNVQAVLAVPIRTVNKMMGVIYLETLDKKVQFDTSHLQFMVAVAGIAGIALENARQLEWLQTENRRLNAEVNLQHSMIGESPRMLELYRGIMKVASTDSTVLLRGESGTGKELAARAIHLNSPRAQKPFVALNCAALSVALLESELFGHEKGAFTGAVTEKKGKIEVADGGTIFLDEIGELAPDLQAKLLRVLQEREFERVGGTRTIKVNIRLIAATNRDLEHAIRDGGFRRDLYFRLNVVSLTIPPLRDRSEDIPLLASYFTSELAKKAGRRITGISREAQKCLTHYDWPGNVRELQNAIERAIVLGTTEVIRPEDLPESLLEKQPAGLQITDYHQAIKETKRQVVLKVLEQAKGNYVQAAKLLGIHPNNLHRLIRELNLKSQVKKHFDKSKSG